MVWHLKRNVQSESILLLLFITLINVIYEGFYWFMMFNATYNNISVTSWRYVEFLIYVLHFNYWNLLSSVEIHFLFA
jgi:hypothetical protein